MLDIILFSFDRIFSAISGLWREHLRQRAACLFLVGIPAPALLCLICFSDVKRQSILYPEVIHVKLHLGFVLRQPFWARSGCWPFS